jgi:hypothetical protein
VVGGRERIGRSLLAASLGIAMVSFVSCGRSPLLETEVPDAGVARNAEASEPADGAAKRPAPPRDAGAETRRPPPIDADVDQQSLGYIIP